MWEAWPKLHSMNVNNCCRWPATMQQPLQHSPQPAALQHRLQAMWRYAAQSICLMSAHLHYALANNTMHWLCMHTFHKLCLTADLAVATSGEIRRLILVSTNHQPGLSDMQQGCDKCSDNSVIQRGKYAGRVGLCWNHNCCRMTGSRIFYWAIWMFP